MVFTDAFMTAKSVFAVWSSEPDAICFLDLRDRDQFGRAHLPTSESLNVWQATDKIRSGSPEILFVVVSPGGREVPELLAFQNVVFIEGGFDSWQSSGFPTQSSEKP